MIRLPPPPPRYDAQHLTQSFSLIEAALRRATMANDAATFGETHVTKLFVNGLPVVPGGGTVTSVSGSGGTTGLTLSGGPITTAGTLTLGGVLDLNNGGTGATTMTGARAALGLGDMALLNDAPNNANTYGRKGAAWSIVPVAVQSVSGGTNVHVDNSDPLNPVVATESSVIFSAVGASDLSVSGSLTLPSDSVTRANLVDAAPRSVIGRSATSPGPVADITAGAGRQFCATGPGVGGTISFRAIDEQDLPGGNWVTATSAEVARLATTNITADDTWTNSLLQITLPAAGTYLVNAVVPVFISATGVSGFSPPRILARLFNASAGAAISNSYVPCVQAVVDSIAVAGSATLSNIILVAGSSIIRVEIYRIGGPTYASSSMIYAAGVFVPRMNYVRLG